MPVSSPLVMLPPCASVAFAQSVHGADFHMADRADPYHKVVYVLAGRVRLEQPSAPPLHAGPGSLLVIPARARHRLADESPASLLLLALDRRFLSRDSGLAALWTTLAARAVRLVHLPRPARLRLEDDWRRALGENHADRPGRACALRAAAAQILVLLARQGGSAAGGEESAPARVAAVAREVEDTFFEPWDLDRGAARAGLSRRRFTTLFRETTGRGFLEHLTDCRLAHAERLLRAGDISILGVMFACGFNDLSHFYRLFRARHGLPPQAWRNAHPSAPTRLHSQTARPRNCVRL